MTPIRKRIRVTLAQPDRPVPAIAAALKLDAELTLTELREPPDELWKKIIALSPDVTAFYAPAFGDAEALCVSRILRGTYSRILLLTENPAAISSFHNPKLELFEYKRPFPDTLGAIRKIKALGQQMKSVFSSSTSRTHDSAPPAANPLPHSSAAAPSPSPAVSAASAAVAHNTASILGTASNSALSLQTASGTIVAIGASTGGTEALAKVFHMLPGSGYLPGIVVVQHMPPVFTNMYAERLNKELPFKVTEAKDNIQIMPGTIHIAPGDRHLVIKKRGTYFYTILNGTEKVNGHCPSVDVLFDSVAEEAGRLATGIILTGMGADGASGLLKMRNRGAFTIGQDEASCVVYGMPRKAFEYGAVVRQSPLDEIAAVLMNHLSK